MRNMVAATRVSGHRRDRRHEHLGRPRHRHAVRADRRAVDRRPGAGGGAERARAAGHPLLSGDVHAGGRREARRPGVPRRVPDRHRSRSAAAGPRRPEIASALSRLYGAQFKLEDAATLFGPKAMLEKIRAGDDPAAIAASWAADEATVAPDAGEVSAVLSRLAAGARCIRRAPTRPARSGNRRSRRCRAAAARPADASRSRPDDSTPIAASADVAVDLRRACRALRAASARAARGAGRRGTYIAAKIANTATTPAP